MNENKISVAEYLEDNELLEIKYTPYDVKSSIVDVILSQVTTKEEINKIDSALLYRISTQVFIEAITNIDMSIVSEENISGFDLLCLYDELDSLIDTIAEEFDRFEDILQLKVDDFHRYNTSTSATLLSLKKALSKFTKTKSDEMNELIQNLDTAAISNKLKNIINENLEKYKGK